MAINTPTTGQQTENETCGVLSPKWAVYSTSFPLRFRNLCGRGYRKIVRARGHRWLQGNGVFQTVPGVHVNSETVAV